MQMCCSYVMFGLCMTLNSVLCANEISEGEPSISIVDNDDFSNDTLTSEGTAHHCNWMYLQCMKHKNNTEL